MAEYHASWSMRKSELPGSPGEQAELSAAIMIEKIEVRTLYFEGFSFSCR